MGILVRKKDTLQVRLDQDTIFLHPSSVNPGEPTDDPILKGVCTLELTRPRRVTVIRVQLKGVTTMHGGGETHRYETSVSLFKELRIDLGGERLDAGQHSYSFSFIIPSTTAVQERSKYGTVRHTVKASCEGLGSFGMGISSLHVPVWLIANPSAQGELPSGLEVLVQDFGAEIGPLAFRVSSSHLTVASLLFMNISFLAPPALSVISVTGYILQQFTIKYDDPDLGSATPPPQKKILFYVDQTARETSHSTDNLIERGNIGRGASLPLAYEGRRLNPKPFAEIEGGREWSYSRIVRVGDDDNVRPSTLAMTDTKIRVNHRLVAEVKYRMPGSKRDMVLAMSTDVTIASCCCLIENLLLPSYVRQTPAKTPVPTNNSLSTRAIHADAPAVNVTGAEVAPYMSTGEWDAADPSHHEYSRYTQPTLNRTEKVLSAMIGERTIMFPSGLAASFAILILYRPDVIAITGGYHGVHAAIEVYQKIRGKDAVKLIELDDEYPTEGSFVCWLETPLNPTGESRSIQHYAEKTHAVGGKLAIDSTFAPPPLQDPFAWGADAVMHSATKYFCGHSDALAGTVSVKKMEEWMELWHNRTYTGANIGSLESWLTLRSLRTLELMKAGAACFSILLEKDEYAKYLPHECRLFIAATSLGGVESLMEHRLVSDPSSDPRLVRLSVGVEDFEDLKNDLEGALHRVYEVGQMREGSGALQG
ncbi:cystathionine gamma-synthase [Pseudohyphozyma bogoriensis]|nr:cystathionine gamma-synthase [Pseudohyphozyma bogoriensis]